VCGVDFETKGARKMHPDCGKLVRLNYKYIIAKAMQWSIEMVAQNIKEAKTRSTNSQSTQSLGSAITEMKGLNL
jgi:hypothetical protein